MASIRKEVITTANPNSVWDALRDVGALHTRLVPGFVVDTRLNGSERIVKFANGMTIREPIITIDEASRRVVWSAIGEPLTHYNASAQVFPEEGSGSKVVWIADFLPDAVSVMIGSMMEDGAKAMKAALDRLPAYLG